MMRINKTIGTIIQRVLALLLAVSLFASGVDAFASPSASNTPKQEIVYINLNRDGSVDKIYVVNAFDLDADGKIIDYGNYTALRNMTSDENIVFDDQTVNIDAKAGKLYYEGVLSNNAIPWDFSIRYFLNGVETQAEALGGKSGALQMKMTVRENTDCDSPFFENYALQASFTLDTNRCKNIVAQNATAANVGRKKQLTYTILPGKGADVAISADVTDFEMDGIAINAVPISMDLDVAVENDADIQEALDGVAKLDDGAGDLNSGVAELLDGVTDLKDGAVDLKDGAEELYHGAVNLKDGEAELKNGVSDLDDGASELLDGSSDLHKGAKDLKKGASDLDDGAAKLLRGSLTMDQGLKDAQSGAGKLADGAKSLEAGAAQMKGGVESLTGGLQSISAQNDAMLGGAYSVFEQLTRQAETQINQSLAQMGISTISLTPENYDTVLTELMSTLRSAGGTPVTMPERAPADFIETAPTPPAQAGDDASKLPGENETPAVDEETPDAPAQTIPDEVLPAQSGSPAQSDPDDAAGNFSDGSADTQAVTLYSTVDDVPYLYAGDTAYQTISAIRAQLNDYKRFYLGLQGYTAGVSTVYDGARNLKKGADTLASGAAALREGAQPLYDGITVLKNGSAEMVAGLTELSTGSGKLLDGTITLEDGTTKLQNGVVALSDGTVRLLEGATSLYDGTIDLCDGTLSMKDGGVELLDGAVALYDGSVTLYDGTIELKDGTVKFRDKTSDLDTTIGDKITTAINEMIGADFQPASFVSPKNTAVEFVQFVIKTDAIEKPEEAEAEVEEEAPVGFWQKLRRLFGFES